MKFEKFFDPGVDLCPGCKHGYWFEDMSVGIWGYFECHHPEEVECAEGRRDVRGLPDVFVEKCSGFEERERACDICGVGPKKESEMYCGPGFWEPSCVCSEECAVIADARAEDAYFEEQKDYNSWR